MWKRDFNAAFVVAVIGVLAWFLNYRIQMKAVTAAAGAEKEDEVENYDDSSHD